MRGVLFLGLCALAGCASGQAPATPVARCRAAAEHDPVVHALKLERLGSQFPIPRLDARLREARARAVSACLQRMGVASSAEPEVEPVHPAY